MYVFDCNGGIKQQLDTSKQLDNAVETGTIQPEGSAESITIQHTTQFHR